MRRKNTKSYYPAELHCDSLRPVRFKVTECHHRVKPVAWCAAVTQIRQWASRHAVVHLSAVQKAKFKVDESGWKHSRWEKPHHIVHSESIWEYTTDVVAYCLLVSTAAVLLARCQDYRDSGQRVCARSLTPSSSSSQDERTGKWQLSVPICGRDLLGPDARPQRGIFRFTESHRQRNFVTSYFQVHLLEQNNAYVCLQSVVSMVYWELIIYLLFLIRDR
jgi:hypothetical protein